MRKNSIAYFIFGAFAYMGYRKMMSGGKLEPKYLENETLLKGKTIVITGATAGVGKESVKGFLRMGASRILVGARNIEKANMVLEKEWEPINKNAKDIISVYYLDNSDFESCKLFTQTIQEVIDDEAIDILMCNAGLYCPKLKANKQGWEYVLSINYLSHVIITQNLLPALKRSKDPRIVNTASIGSKLYRKAFPTWEQLKGNGSAIFKSGRDTYTFSKLAQVCYARGMAKYEPNITTVSLHPGAVITDIWKINPVVDFFTYGLMHLLPMKSSWEGAQTMLHCAVASPIVNGGYYVDCNSKTHAKYAQDDERIEDFFLKSHEAVAQYLEVPDRYHSK